MKQIAIVLSFIFIPGQNKMFQFRITINANKNNRGNKHDFRI